MGPEHPTDDSQVGVSYTEFENLEDVGVVDFTNLQSLFTGEDWKMHYEGLNIIRALNKHQRDTLLGRPDEVVEETFFSKAIAPFVREHIDNLRSNLSKCALMLIKEVFQMSGKEERPD